MILKEVFHAARSAAAAAAKFAAEVDELATNLSLETGKSKTKSVIHVVKSHWHLQKGMM